MTIGKKIELLRKAHNLTQEQLAEIVQVSRQTIYKWEQDLSKPSYEKLTIFVNYFHLTFDDVLRDSKGFRIVTDVTETNND